MGALLKFQNSINDHYLTLKSPVNVYFQPNSIQVFKVFTDI